MVTVTFTTPVPAGLTAVIVVALTTVTPVAAVGPKATAVAPVKPVPVIVTKMPPAVGPARRADARDRRRGGHHGQREALGGVGGHAVGGCDRQRVGAAVPAAGVPASVAVPSPLSTNVTPAGSAPVSVSAAVGNPVVVTVNVPAVPT